MTDETLFRILLAALAVFGFAISLTFRRRADKAGGRISRLADGRLFVTLQMIWVFSLLGSLLLYLLMPSWIVWARLELPLWARWLGVAIGALSLPGLVWMFRHLGDNITPTASVRREHRLVTTGPYRFIRHPLYTFGTLWWLGMSLVMASWFTALMTVLTFAAIARRVVCEEAALIERFGDDYRRYMARTPRYIPSWRSRSKVRPGVNKATGHELLVP